MENLRLPEMQHLHIKQINLLNNFISEFLNDRECRKHIECRGMEEICSI